MEDRDHRTIPPPTRIASVGMMDPQQSHHHDARGYVAGNVAHLSPEEVDAVIENFAKEDDTSKKTMTRIIVENYLSKFTWYFPSQMLRNPPSLSKAYAYYEHITLPRYYVGEYRSGHIMRRAEPGECVEQTEMYPVWVPSTSLIEWGIGVDQYFSTVRFFAFILFAAGLLLLPNIRFFASTEYSPEGKDVPNKALLGTAICGTNEWVVCTECNPEVFRGVAEGRVLVGDDGTVLILRTLCNGGELLEGMINWVVLVFLIVVVTLTSLYLRAREVRFDEDKLTATDYSVIVKNPPSDALDPDEWKDFFSQFTEHGSQVTAVTIGLNNEELLRKLIYRRVHKNQLRMKLPKGINMDNENIVRAAVAQFINDRDAEPRGCLRRMYDCTVLPILRSFGMFLPAEVLVEKVFGVIPEIRELQEKKYDAVKVFVTFETEESQRTALSTMAVGKFDIMSNNTAKSPSIAFRGQVLDVCEPPEPSSVRWLDLSAGKVRRIAWRLISFALTMLIVAFCGYVVAQIRYSNLSRFAAPVVSVFNSTIPIIIKILMIFEKHHSEGSFQSSLYLKITLFRWINTALLTKLLTPFSNTLDSRSEDVIRQISAILWSELWLTPALRLLEPVSNFEKHVLAPRARTQEEMNMNFQGTIYNLGERYTDLSKILFVCCFYSSLIPTSFFFGAAILFVQFYTDKYCLTRIWAWTPALGNELARASRRYFFSGTIVALAVVAAYTYAGFPYDNVCDAPDSNSGYAGLYSNLTFRNGTRMDGSINVTQDTAVIYCNQRWSGFDGFLFPPVSKKQHSGREWMTDSQATLSNVYGWTAFALVLVYLLLFFGSGIISYFRSCFAGTYSPGGQDQHIDYSSNLEIYGYVPLVKWIGFPFPFLACDIDNIDTSLIGWTDPTKSYDHHNLIFDIPWKGLTRARALDETVRLASPNTSQREPSEALPRMTDARPIYSIIKHYPPAWAIKLKNEAEELK